MDKYFLILIFFMLIFSYIVYICAKYTYINIYLKCTHIEYTTFTFISYLPNDYVIGNLLIFIVQIWKQMDEIICN